jgi:hypothetical protein
MEQRDYNVMSENGITDQEYVDRFGLPQALVGTPEMNDWMLNKTYEDNIVDCTEDLISKGESRDKAKSKCTSIAGKNKKAAMKLLKEVQKRRGY